jgi:hypothetical protein
VVDRTLRTNLVSLVFAYSNLLIVLVQIHSCSMFDLTLDVIPNV